MHIVCGAALLLVLHMPYYWRICKWFFRILRKTCSAILFNYKVVATDIRTYAGVSYSGEKYQAGSDYYPSTLPPFQLVLSVRRKDGDGWDLIGHAYRMGNYLVTANHVVVDHSDIRVSGKGGYVDISVDAFKDHGYDIALANLTSSLWVSTGAKCATIPKMGLGYRQVVGIFGREQASNGVLAEYTTIPYLMYQGSTMAGFSGAPYYVGNTVYGLHVGAAQQNLAIDSNFIESLVRKDNIVGQSYKGESSEDILFGQIYKIGKRGNKSKAFQYAPGELSVLVDGKYHNMYVEDVPEDIYTYLDIKPSGSPSYDGETVMDGATFDAIDSNATVSLNLKTGPAVAAARMLKRAVPASKQRKWTSPQIDLSQRDQVMMEPPMGGPALIAAQSSEASGSTAIFSQDMISQLRKMLDQTVRQQLRNWKPSSSATNTIRSPTMTNE